MKTLTVELKISNVIFDVTNSAYYTGKARFDGSNFEYVSNIQVGEDDGEIDVLLRSISTAKAKLTEVMSIFIKDSSESVTSTLEIISAWETEKATFVLTVPTNFNMAVKDAITNKCHDYLMHTALGDWLSISAPNEANLLYSKATDDLIQLRSSLNKRIKPTRRTSTTI